MRWRDWASLESHAKCAVGGWRRRDKKKAPAPLCLFPSPLEIQMKTNAHKKYPVPSLSPVPDPTWGYRLRQRLSCCIICVENTERKTTTESNACRQRIKRLLASMRKKTGNTLFSTSPFYPRVYIHSWLFTSYISKYTCFPVNWLCVSEQCYQFPLQTEFASYTF